MRLLKLLLLFAPGRFGRAERLLWRHLSRRQRRTLYLRHRFDTAGYRLYRSTWPRIHSVYRADSRSWCCYRGPSEWMPRADILLAMKCHAEATGYPMTMRLGPLGLYRDAYWPWSEWLFFPAPVGALNPRCAAGRSISAQWETREGRTEG